MEINKQSFPVSLLPVLFQVVLTYKYSKNEFVTIQNFGVVLSVMLNMVVQGCYKFQLFVIEALPSDYLKRYWTLQCSIFIRQ